MVGKQRTQSVGAWLVLMFSAKAQGKEKRSSAAAVMVGSWKKGLTREIFKK